MKLEIELTSEQVETLGLRNSEEKFKTYEQYEIADNLKNFCEYVRARIANFEDALKELEGKELSITKAILETNITSFMEIIENLKFYNLYKEHEDEL